MSPKKIIFIVPLIFLAVIVYELSRSTKVAVENDVHPYLERLLGLTIEKDYKGIYDKYLHERALPFENFCARMDYFSNIFGAEPASFSYERSHVGGEGYYITYRLVLSDDKSYPCIFEFPAKETSPIRTEDLEVMSVSADFGEKSFQIFFESGNVLACKVPEGSYDEDSMHEGTLLEKGDRVFVYGGYDNKPEWLSGRAGYSGTIERFIPGQNDTPAAVIRTDDPVTANGVTGNILVMQLRWVGATWRSGAVAHIELCDFEPKSVRWEDRRQGEWVESHARIRHQ